MFFGLFGPCNHKYEVKGNTQKCIKCGDSKTIACAHLFGAVDKHGIQCCTKCGKRECVPCNHRWEEIDKYPVTEGSQNSQAVSGIVHVLKCTICGDMKTKKITANG